MGLRVTVSLFLTCLLLSLSARSKYHNLKDQRFLRSLNRANLCDFSSVIIFMVILGFFTSVNLRISANFPRKILASILIELQRKHRFGVCGL